MEKFDCFPFLSWRFSLTKLYFGYKHSYKRLDLLSLTAAQTWIIYCLTLWGNNGFNFFTSRCSPVIIARLDAFIWLNGIFGWLDQHGAVTAQFSSHLSGSISGAATWRRADWRLQTDSWKQMSWGGGERSRDGGSFRGSVWIRAVILDYRPFQCSPNPFYFFLPYWRLSWQYWTVSMEKGWARATLPLYSLAWQRGGGKKRTILTPYLVGWNNRISHIWCFFERASEGVVVVVGWGRNAPWHTREQLRYKRCSWKQARLHDATLKWNKLLDLKGNFLRWVPTGVACRLFCHDCTCKSRNNYVLQKQKVFRKLPPLGTCVARLGVTQMTGENSPKWLFLQMLFALWGSVDPTSIIPHDSRGRGDVITGSTKDGEMFIPIFLMPSGLVTRGERFTTENTQPRWCHSCTLMHRLWLRLSSDVFSAALTGLRHAGTITGRSNLNATLAATTTADTVAVKTPEYQTARYA